MVNNKTGVLVVMLLTLDVTIALVENDRVTLGIADSVRASGLLSPLVVTMPAMLDASVSDVPTVVDT